MIDPLAFAVLWLETGSEKAGPHLQTSSKHKLCTY